MEMEAIHRLITKSGGIPAAKIFSNSDLNEELGIEGDDFFELMEQFEKEFEVNMEGYRWYFHHCEEGWNFGGLFIKPPCECVERIPVTPTLLLQAATTKEWSIVYPEYNFPERRYDILINQIVLVCTVLGGLTWLIA